MEGTEEVRREAEESVRRLIARRSKAKPRRPPAPAPRSSCRPSPTACGCRASAARSGSGRRPRTRSRRPSAGPAARPRRRPRRPRPSWLQRRAVDRADRRLPHLLGRRASSNLAAMREVRIRDTLSGEARPIEPETAWSGIYACGPTVYSRIHIGNARPFVVFSLLARFLDSEGYEAKLVVNVTDVNDKIYAAARERGVPSAEWAAGMTRAYFEDTEPARARPARRRAAGDRDGRRDRRPDRRAGRVRPRLRGRRRRLLPGPQLRRLRQALQPRPRADGPGRGGGLGAREGEPARLRPLESDQGGRGHQLGLALGPGPAGLAHRVLGDGRGGAGRRLLDPRRRLGPGLPPPRERDRPVGVGRGGPFAQLWMHNGMVRTGAEKMSKSEGNIFQLSRGAGPVWARGGGGVPGLGALPAAVGVRARRRWSEAVARVERLRNFFRAHPVEGASGGGLAGATAGRLRRGLPRLRASSAFREALADDFNTPRALAELFELVGKRTAARSPGLRRRSLRRCSGSSGRSRSRRRRRGLGTRRRR